MYETHKLVRPIFEFMTEVWIEYIKWKHLVAGLKYLMQIIELEQRKYNG